MPEKNGVRKDMAIWDSSTAPETSETMVAASVVSVLRCCGRWSVMATGHSRAKVLTAWQPGSGEDGGGIRKRVVHSRACL